MINSQHTYSSVILIAAMSVAVPLVFSVGAVAAQDTNESLDEPVKVGDVEGLTSIRDDLDGDYVLVDDINLSGFEGFEPIGGVGSREARAIEEREGAEANYAPPFNGTLDGNGHQVTGLSVDRPDSVSIGLFGVVGSGAEIRNLGVVGVDLRGMMTVGGIAGRANPGSDLRNSYVTGEVVAERGPAGGLLGVNVGKVVRSRSEADVEVVDGRAAGGIVGNNLGEVAESYATGDVVADGGVGGIVGNNLAWVNDSYATGDVTGGSSVEMGIGGLVGTNVGFVRRSYAAGKVSGDGDHVGGLVGRNEHDEGVRNSYWDTELTEQPNSDGGVGLSTDEMTGRSASDRMQGFNFTETWEATDGGYPRLRWQNVSDSHKEGETTPGFTLAVALLAIFALSFWRA